MSSPDRSRSPRIADVEVYVLKSPLDEPFAFSQGWVRQRAATLVRITTDDGIVGWGEAFAQGLEPPEISAAVIEHALRPLVLGQNALDSSVRWHEMYAATRDYGRKGSVVSAISAIDIALWDIAGHHFDQPIHQLLGGAHRRHVQPYATGFYRIEGRGEAERLAREAIQHRRAGFRAMKVKLGFGVDDDIAVMEAVARALDDPTIELMIDTNHAYGRAEALRLADALASFPLRWFEEPLVPEDLDGYRALRSQTSIPIAAGENEHTAFGFNALFEADAVDIAQPDVGSCGGITAMRDIVSLAHANGVVVNPHVWGTAVAQAASLHVIASIPTTHHSLFATQPVFEYDQSDHPFRRDLVTRPLSIVDGVVAIPTGPGLGIEIREETIERYAVD